MSIFNLHKNLKIKSIDIFRMPTGGLANLGNTCSINTLLQCMAHCVSFSKFIITNDIYIVDEVKRIRREGNEGGKDGKSYLLINEIKDVFQFIIINKQSIVPKRFIKAFHSVAGSAYGMGDEHDLTEIFMLILDTIIKETNNSTTTTNKIFKNSKSPLINIFYGTQIQQVICSNCCKIYHNTEPVAFHYIQVRNNTSVVNSLINMFAEEVLTEWKCDKCSKHSGVRSLHLSLLPKILVIVLQRCSTNSKINTPIDITETIIIENTTYRLKGIANHYGTHQSGHYTAFCKDESDDWYEYNDLHISKIEQERIERILIQNRDAYALFYET